MSGEGLAEFLLARLAEAEAPTFELVPYECPPGCCAPAGWTGHQCLICEGGPSFGGTVEAVTEMARDHEERVHNRRWVLADAVTKRRIIGEHSPVTLYSDGTHADSVRVCKSCGGSDAYFERSHLPAMGAAKYPCLTLRLLAAPFADHPDYRQDWAL